MSAYIFIVVATSEARMTTGTLAVFIVGSIVSFTAALWTLFRPRALVQRRAPRAIVKPNSATNLIQPIKAAEFIDGPAVYLPQPSHRPTAEVALNVTCVVDAAWLTSELDALILTSAIEFADAAELHFPECEDPMPRRTPYRGNQLRDDARAGFFPQKCFDASV